MGLLILLTLIGVGLVLLVRAASRSAVPAVSERICSECGGSVEVDEEVCSHCGAELPATSILIVGEEQWMAESLQAAMGQSGCQVIAAQAQAAEEAIHRHRPVLIIACMSGRKTADLDLCRMLCNVGGVPVIAIGSPQDTECQLAAFDAGVDDYLIRPANLQVLAARIRGLLHRRTWTPIPSEFDASTPTLSRKEFQ